jgi:hypothetical protein
MVGAGDQGAKRVGRNAAGLGFPSAIKKPRILRGFLAGKKS